ncbi:MAG: hypothetical protein HQK51_19805 [Oligoflexia bacterium]|nr:hypothetical protein [Oligoflexia bacterium]
MHKIIKYCLIILIPLYSYNLKSSDSKFDQKTTTPESTVDCEFNRYFIELNDNNKKQNTDNKNIETKINNYFSEMKVLTGNIDSNKVDEKINNIIIEYTDFIQDYCKLLLACRQTAEKISKIEDKGIQELCKIQDIKKIEKTKNNVKLKQIRCEEDHKNKCKEKYPENYIRKKQQISTISCVENNKTTFLKNANNMKSKIYKRIEERIKEAHNPDEIDRINIEEEEVRYNEQVRTYRKIIEPCISFDEKIDAQFIGLQKQQAFDVNDIRNIPSLIFTEKDKKK